MTVPTVRTLADQVWDLLRAVSNVNHYDGEVAPHPPLDPDGRVHAYEVFYPGAGRQIATRSCATPAALAWSFQVTCVGGDRNRALWCIDKIRAGLHERRLDGGHVIRPATDTDLGVIRRDDDVTPPRYYLPLFYAVYIP